MTTLELVTYESAASAAYGCARPAPIQALLKPGRLRVEGTFAECTGALPSSPPHFDQTTARVRVVGYDKARVTPPPDREEEGLLEWTWASDETPPAIEVELPLSWDQYATASIEGGRGLRHEIADGTYLWLSLNPLAGWIGLLLATTVIAAAMVSGGLLSREVALRLAGFTAALVAGASLSIDSSRSFEISRGVVPLLATATAVVLLLSLGTGASSRRRRVVIGCAVLAVIAALIALGSSASSPLLNGTAASLALLIGGAAVLAGLALELPRAIGDSAPGHDGSARGWVPAKHALNGLIAGAFFYGVGWIAGIWFESRSLSRTLSYSVPSIPYFGMALGTAVVVVVGFTAAARAWPPRPLKAAAVFAVGALWALAAGPQDAIVAGIRLPVGLVALGLALVLVVRRGNPGSVLDREIDRSELHDAPIARQLLNHGPKADERANLLNMLEIGALIAVVPVAYFAWGLLESVPDRTQSHLGAMFLVSTLVIEIARWLATAMTYGLLHRFLPGSIGVLRAACLSAAWLLAAAAAEITVRWTDRGTGRIWLFPGLQLFVYLLALALAYDFRTVRAAGGGWIELQAVYRIEPTRNFVALAAPVLVAVLAIAQQVASGSGLDFVRSVVENAPSLVPMR